ncbi:Mu transposase C-terminal domain-containing protein [Streptomyces sp. NPDC050428]|uniref:Mu transposase C-terminal domain-containing protein n=1 Tax=Streptomyces sp. NPDC050428 TaxID=3155757 RepID=UPI00341D5FE6
MSSGLIWPADKLNALRLGRRPVAEVQASRPDRVDGGKEFLCNAVGEAFGRIGTERIVLPPFTPEGKPTVEAVNGTIKKTLFAGMPGYTHAPTLRGGKPVDPDQPLLHFESFVALVRDWVHWWNHEHTIRSLDGQTPAQAWNADTTPIETIAPDDLHTYTLERHGAPLTINNSGVRWRKKNYIADWMHGLAREKVTLRYLPEHDRRIELYDPRTHRHLGPAFMANQATPEQTRALTRARRCEADRLRAQLKKAEKNRRVRYAAATEPAPPQPLDALPEEQALEHLRDLDGFDLTAQALPGHIPLPAPADEWTRPEPPNSADTCDQKIIEALEQEPRVLLLDEVQWLGQTALEYFRSLWGDEEQRAAVSLVGSAK